MTNWPFTLPCREIFHRTPWDWTGDWTGDWQHSISYVGVLALSLLEVCLGVVVRHSVLVRVRLGRLLSFIALGETESKGGREHDHLERQETSWTTEGLRPHLQHDDCVASRRQQTLELDCRPPALYTNLTVSVTEWARVCCRTAGRLSVWPSDNVSLAPVNSQHRDKELFYASSLVFYWQLISHNS